MPIFATVTFSPTVTQERPIPGANALEVAVPRVDSSSVEAKTATKDLILIFLFNNVFDSYFKGILSQTIFTLGLDT